jgi:serine/threonine-protein kinase SRPK3
MLITTCQDVKPDNVLVTIPQPETLRIDKYIQSNPASIYGPPLNLESSPLPLAFSCSEPLPYFDLGGSIEDISIRLVDYGEGGPTLPLIHHC